MENEISYPMNKKALKDIWVVSGILSRYRGLVGKEPFGKIAMDDFVSVNTIARKCLEETYNASLPKQQEKISPDVLKVMQDLEFITNEVLMEIGVIRKADLEAYPDYIKRANEVLEKHGFKPTYEDGGATKEQLSEQQSLLADELYNLAMGEVAEWSTEKICSYLGITEAEYMTQPEIYHERATQKYVNEGIDVKNEQLLTTPRYYFIAAVETGNHLHDLKAKGDDEAKEKFQTWVKGIIDANDNEKLADEFILKEALQGGEERVVHAYQKNISYFKKGGGVTADAATIDKGTPLEVLQLQNPDASSMPYIPKSAVCLSVDTVAPVGMLLDMEKSLAKIDHKVRGVDYYVQTKLGYKNLFDLCNAFSSEQVDAIANAIYQIEEKKQSLIVGDGTGVGKGRSACGVLRYAKMRGIVPIFITEKATLFSDIYRDATAIGLDDGIILEYNTGESEKEKRVTIKEIKEAIYEDIANGEFDMDYDTDKLFTKEYQKETNQCIEEYRELYFPNEIVTVTNYKRNENYREEIKTAKRFVPFIVNGASEKTKIKVEIDDRFNVLYKGLSGAETKKVFQSGVLPEGYDCILMTYSQINSPKRAVDKIEWLKKMAQGSIIVLDESHVASGASNTGVLLQEILKSTEGCCFLSATFAKRPDNMPVYAMKTALMDAGMPSAQLVEAILAGGVALQEILSAELVREGQMLRRERSYAGIEVNYNYLDESMLDRDVPLPQFMLKDSHIAISDKVTSVIRRILAFQAQYVNPIIDKKDKEYAEQQKAAHPERQNVEGGIGNPPVFSGIFNVINQLLLSIKAEAVADWAIMRMKEGKKPIIALSNTLESFLNYLATGKEKGEKIKTDFSVILQRRLDKTLEYTVDNGEEKEKHALDPDDYDLLGAEYYSIMKEIEHTTTGITVSPIDAIKTRIANAGFIVEEVTGRNKYVEFLPDGKHGFIKPRKKSAANDLFIKFNNNLIDCLIVNQSGSTGASAHALVTPNAFEVKYDANGNAIIPSSLEPRYEIKQRCMLILQAELNINTEVQKRGRINRTGQVFKPMYEYIFSAIPAEKRLAMMLQKKLKSLDANTASNQKQSSKSVLNVVDFLNIYGDDKVVEFLEANNEYIDLTGNNLKFEFGKPSEATEAIEDKAHKVSGRVAILSVEMQEKFYQTITDTYTAYEQQLKASGDWKLEVERMELASKTLAKNVVSTGDPTAKSVFGEAVFIEKCEINNLNRPLSREEVKTMIDNALSFTDSNGKTIKFSSHKERQEHLKELFIKRVENSLAEALDTVKKFRAMRLKEMNEMPSLEKKNATEKAEIIKAKTEDINAEFDAREERLKNGNENLKRMIGGYIDFFPANKLVAYPMKDYATTGDFVKAVCLGIQVDMSEFNPFAPSRMSVVFAMPNGMRLIRLPLSDGLVAQIRDTTVNDYDINDTSESDTDRYVEDWHNVTKAASANRIIRYIVTGNILKGYGNPDFKSGKLIRYTTENKDIKQGILLPDKFGMEQMEELKVSVPLNKAWQMITRMSNNAHLYLASDVILSRWDTMYTIEIHKSSALNKIKDNTELTALAANPTWALKNRKWTNSFEQRAMPDVIRVLWDTYRLNIRVAPSVFEIYKDEFSIEERTHETVDGTEQLIAEQQRLLDEYKKSGKQFQDISEEGKQNLSEEDLEKHEFIKRSTILDVTRRLYRVQDLLMKEVRRRKQEAKKKVKQAELAV